MTDDQKRRIEAAAYCAGIPIECTPTGGLAIGTLPYR